MDWRDHEPAIQKAFGENLMMPGASAWFEGMPAVRRQKPPRGLDGSTRSLIDAGERLFGEYGIAGASMRVIAAEAGHGNNYAVQHHFGSKMGLVRAILEVRTYELDIVREQLVRDLAQQGPLDLRTLLECSYLPIAQTTDASGHLRFARFRSRIIDEIGADPWHVIREFAPVGMAVTQRIRDLLPHLDDTRFGLRFAMTSMLFYAAVGSIVLRKDLRRDAEVDRLVSEVIAACAGVLRAE
jgi:AcrR family transcriptional regulator